MANKKKSKKKNGSNSGKKKNYNNKSNKPVNKQVEKKPELEEKKEELEEKVQEEIKEEVKQENNNGRTEEVSVINDEVLEQVEEVEEKQKEEQVNEETLEEPVEEVTEEVQEESTEESKEVKQSEDETKEDEEEPQKLKTHTAEVPTIKEEKPKEKEEKKDKESPDYIEKPKDKFKGLKRFFIIVLVLAILGFLFSTVFALLNINNTTIINETLIKDIDVSYMTQEEARKTVKEELQNQLSKKIKFVYSDYSREFETSEIEFEYKADDAVQKAYDFSRKGNLVENNYAILKTFIFGEKIEPEYTYNEEALEKILDTITTSVPGLVEHPSHYIDGDGLYIDKGKDGIQVKRDELRKLLLNDIIERSSDSKDVQEIKIPTENKKADKIDLDKILLEIKKEPKDAYYETEPDFKIYREENGVDFGVSMEEAKEIISKDENAIVGEDGIAEFRIPLKITPAEKTINDIGLEAFPYEIETFTTRYDETNYNRTNNLEIATEKISGTVLMPGETFSYNQVVGKRTIEEGYRNAKIYENGQVVDGLAGGICQVSSTLYNVALLSNLEIVERHNHSFTTSYLAAGRDATVVYGVKDLQFTNTRSYPVKIIGELESGILRFTMYGIKEEEEYDIKIIPTTTGTIPFTEKRTVDNSLAPGQVKIDQYGHPGSRVTTRMQKYLNGELVYDEVISSDVYSPMQSIIRVGPDE